MLEKTESAKLGIWIPTYNRPQYFHRLIDSISNQKDNIEVWVGLQPPYDNYNIPDWCNVIFNETNIGQSLNIMQGIEKVPTEYLWMVGDDEQVLPNAIEEILRLIEYNPGMIICTDGKFDHGPNGLFKNWSEWMQECINCNREVMLTAQTLMTVTVFRRKGVNIEESYKYLNTRYGHHFGILSGLISEPVAITNYPVFISGKAIDSHVWSESPSYQSEHCFVTSGSLTELIRYASELTGNEYPSSCYQPGIGFDG